MDYLKFEELVKEALDSVPKKFIESLDNVVICIKDDPSKKEKRKLKIRDNEFLFGLYEGIPKTERWQYGFSLPDKITIFKNMIERYAKNEKEIMRIIRETVWHEIAHHFGMDEKMVRNAEKKKKQKS